MNEVKISIASNCSWAGMPTLQKEIYMKALIILSILGTLAIIFFQYSRNKNLKKLLIALVTFGIIISLAIVGNLTRQIIPLFMAHIILVIVSWGGLILYLIRDKYYWWIIFSPAVTIGLFLLLELLTGSGHELVS
jgi:hypothetical protein